MALGGLEGSSAKTQRKGDFFCTTKNRNKKHGSRKGRSSNFRSWDFSVFFLKKDIGTQNKVECNHLTNVFVCTKEKVYQNDLCKMGIACVNYTPRSLTVRP